MSNKHSCLRKILVSILLASLLLLNASFAVAQGNPGGPHGDTKETGSSRGDQQGRPGDPGQNQANPTGCLHGEPDCVDSSQQLPGDQPGSAPGDQSDSPRTDESGRSSQPQAPVPYTYHTDVGELAANDVTTTDTDVVTYQVDGSTLSHPVTVAADLPGNNWHFHFEPNGSRGVFSNTLGDHTNLVVGASRDPSWYQMLTDVPDGVHLIYPVWSPTDNGILFTEHVVDASGATVSAHIFKTDMRGPDMLKIDVGADGFWADISPDGQLFAFTDRDSGTLFIGSMFAERPVQQVLDHQGRPIKGVRWQWDAEGQGVYGINEETQQWFYLSIVDGFQVTEIDTCTCDVTVDPDYMRSRTAFVIGEDNWPWYDSAPIVENERALAIAHNQPVTDEDSAIHDNLDWIKPDTEVPNMERTHYMLWSQRTRS